MFEANLLIGRSGVDASGCATFDRHDPVTGEVATRAAAATVKDAANAANAAAAAFPEWAASGPGRRRECLGRAAVALRDRADELVAMQVSETGATRAWAGFNVKLGADILTEAAAMTTQVTGDVIPTDRSGTLALGMRQAAGVCLGIAPWNAAVILAVRAVAMPLACGNTVLLKASELCPGTHRLIGEIVAGAGLPPGALNVVTNAPKDAQAVVEALIAHPAVRRVSFTGSTRVGRTVAETAARHLKRCLLELGGKAAVVVLDDAVVGEAVEAIAFGAFMNQGQICMSTERVVVMDEVADEIVSRLATKASGIRAADPRSGEAELGSMINADAVARVRVLLEDAIAKGARIVAGGPGRGAMMDATVVDHVTPAMRLYREESFAPVASIIRVGSVDEAVTVANDTEYGLSSAVYGRDVGRALKVAQRIESGICHVNGPTVADEPQMPFGGVKASGYGRFGGRAAIDEFTEVRWITVGQSAGSRGLGSD